MVDSLGGWIAVLPPFLYLISEALPQLAILIYHKKTFSAMDKQIKLKEEDRATNRNRYRQIDFNSRS
jgi:hypothetical protein